MKRRHRPPEERPYFCPICSERVLASFPLICESGVGTGYEHADGICYDTDDFDGGLIVNDGIAYQVTEEFINAIYEEEEDA